MQQMLQSVQKANYYVVVSSQSEREGKIDRKRECETGIDRERQQHTQEGIHTNIQSENQKVFMMTLIDRKTGTTMNMNTQKCDNYYKAMFQINAHTNTHTFTTRIINSF